MHNNVCSKFRFENCTIAKEMSIMRKHLTFCKTIKFYDNDQDLLWPLPITEKHLMTSIFLSSSEAFASELLRNLEEMIKLLYSLEMLSQFISCLEETNIF